MIHDQHVYHKWHGFSFFMSFPEPPMEISGEGSFPEWSAGFLINFPALLGVGS